MATLSKSLKCLYAKKVILRNPIWLFAMLCLSSSSLLANRFYEPLNPILDSLTIHLEDDLSPQERTDVLLELSKEWSSINQETASKYAEQAIKSAEESQDSSRLLDAKIQQSNLLVNFSQSYPSGVALLTESLDLARALKKPAKEFRALYLLGYVHTRMESFNLALQYFQLALILATENGYEQDQTDILMRIAEVLEFENRQKEAQAYYDNVIERESRNDYADTPPETMVYLGVHFERTKDYPKALQFFRRSIPKFEQSDSPRWVAYIWSQIALVEFEMGNEKSALESGMKGLQIAEQNQLKKELVDNHENLSVIHDSLGNHKEALYHFRELTQINDDIYSVEKAAQFASIQANHDLVLKELTLQQTKVENELQANRLRIIYISTFLILFLVAVLVYFAYRRYRLKKNINLQLEGRGELKNLSMSEVVKQLRTEVEHHQETREQLEKSNEELNHFLYKSSHDLRGPLVSVLGLISLAELEGCTESERDQYLNLIRVSTTRISHKLDALLHATRLKEKELEIQPVNLQKLIQESIAELMEGDESIPVDVLVDVAPGLTLETDEVLMKTLVSNLVENGIRFRDPDRQPAQVWVSARFQGPKLLFKVRDNGLGIPASEHEKVFEMFVRSDFKQGGSGLGLYLVKKIVEKLDGIISLRSKVGDGTVVEVLLG